MLYLLINSQFIKLLYYVHLHMHIELRLIFYCSTFNFNKLFHQLKVLTIEFASLATTSRGSEYLIHSNKASELPEMQPKLAARRWTWVIGDF